MNTKHDKRHAFCETMAAIVTHIRPLTEQGRKEGGGADTRALCGAHAAWDTKSTFSRRAVETWKPWPYPLCSKCEDAFLKGGTTR